MCNEPVICALLKPKNIQELENYSIIFAYQQIASSVNPSGPLDQGIEIYFCWDPTTCSHNKDMLSHKYDLCRWSFVVSPVSAWQSSLLS